MGNMTDKIINYVVTDLSLKDFCQKYNYHIIRLSNANKSVIADRLYDIEVNKDKWMIVDDMTAIVEKWLNTSGTPDFFLYNEREWLLCEFKSCNDYLRKEQINFFKEYQNTNILVLQSTFELKEPELLQIIFRNYKDTIKNIEDKKSEVDNNGTK